MTAIYSTSPSITLPTAITEQPYQPSAVFSTAIDIYLNQNVFFEMPPGNDGQRVALRWWNATTIWMVTFSANVNGNSLPTSGVSITDTPYAPAGFGNFDYMELIYAASVSQWILSLLLQNISPSPIPYSVIGQAVVAGNSPNWNVTMAPGVFSHTLAVFTFLDTTVELGDVTVFSAVLGGTSNPTVTATVTGANGVFTVSGSVTFTAAGVYVIQANIQQTTVAQWYVQNCRQITVT